MSSIENKSPVPLNDDPLNYSLLVSSKEAWRPDDRKLLREHLSKIGNFTKFVTFNCRFLFILLILLPLIPSLNIDIALELIIKSPSVYYCQPPF